MRHLLLLLAALPLLAQTTITPPQIRLGAPGEVQNLRLYAVGLSGMVQIAIGPGLKIELVNGVPTLTVDPIPARITFEPMVIISRVLVQDQNGNYVCPKCERVFRNGIRQAPGSDYATNPNGILPKQPWAADDVVLGEWIDKPETPGPQAGLRQLEALAEAGVSSAQINQASVAAQTLVRTRQVAPRENYNGARFVAEPSGADAAPRRTLIRHEQIRNWHQVSPNDWLPRADSRRRPGVAISQIERRTLWHDWTRPPDPPQLLVTISY